MQIWSAAMSESSSWKDKIRRKSFYYYVNEEQIFILEELKPSNILSFAWKKQTNIQVTSPLAYWLINKSLQL